MVDRLEKAGYLRRIRDVRDRRQVLVEIIWEELLHRLMAYYEPVGDALADYADEELDRIAELTARASNVLDAVVRAFVKPASGTATGPTVTPR